MNTSAAPNWESFYRDYRKPGFVQGFEILNKLGGGAFGIVYKARKESIAKDYAIKFLKLDEPNMRSAVLKELESVSLFAQIDHPNLVTIEDRGEVHGIPYILMGYAGEDTLRERLDRGPMPRDVALRLFAQVARGLQALHDHSLVHFDLKPGNVFLRGDIARLGDYGLSKLVSSAHNSLSFGRGTPYYMAPEQLQQRGDTRSDIYSLGVILYECLTGDVPFRGDSEWEILKKHEQAEPVFPSSLSPQEKGILARCLQKDPEARYQRVDTILEDLLGAAPPLGAPTRTPASASTRTPQPPPLPKTRKAKPRHQRQRAHAAASPANLSSTAKAAQTAAAELRRPHRKSRRVANWVFCGMLAVPLVAWVVTNPKIHYLTKRSARSGHSEVASATATVESLAIPKSVRKVRPHIERALSELQRNRINTSQAICRLKSCEKGALILGANKLASLDFNRKSDSEFGRKLQAVMSGLTRYRFRYYGLGHRKQEKQNRRVAQEFLRHVQSRYY